MKKKSMDQKKYPKVTPDLKSDITGNMENQSPPGSRYSRRSFLKITGAGMTGVCLGGLAGSLIPAGASAAESPVFGGTLKIGMNADVVGMDPH